jgi:hypothetical protein
MEPKEDSETGTGVELNQKSMVAMWLATRFNDVHTFLSNDQVLFSLVNNARCV